MKRLSRVGLPILALILAGVAFYLGGEGNNTAALLTGISAGVLLAVAALVTHPLLGGAVTAAEAACVSLYLTIQHHAATAGGESVCNINETFNCDIVNTSQYAELFGVPIALFGVGFYVGVAAFTLPAWQEKEGTAKAPALLLLAAIPACGYSLFLAWASSTLGAWCLFCMSLYTANALLLVAGVLATRPDGFTANIGAALTGQNDRSIMTLIVAGLAAFAIGWLGWGKPAAPPLAEQVEADIGQLYESVNGTVALSGHEPIWGSPSAEVLLVEFADYECPHCALMAKEVKALVTKHPELRVAHRHYPLSSICNPSVPDVMHENACMAAAAAICAQEQGRFWEMNQQMFANQRFLSRDDIRFIAQNLGLDVDALDGCMSSPQTGARVSDDVEAGKTAGVYSTPSLFVRDLTRPGEWIRVTTGSEGLELLLEARAKGASFPTPRPPSAPY
ncbi:MAG: thioredoxin domain-containing protein [Alphaproteobacteria bacterium]|nr:thioredoxin domain-containing protein [Alphaproteobacteria bacterium]